MSSKFSILPADALFDERLTHAQVRCLGFICYYGAQKTQGCWPSYETIAANMQTDRRNIIRYVKALCDAGYVTKEKRQQDSGLQTSNVYRVNFEIELVEIVTSSSGKNNHHPSGNLDHQGSGKNNHPKEQENLTGKSNNKKITKKITLQQYEQGQGGVLCAEQMVSWIKENRLDVGKVRLAIIEFRDVMLANGNVYADFPACFKNYMRRGFLSLNLQSCALPRREEPVAKFETYDTGSRL